MRRPHAGKQISRGPCCAHNSSRWSWPRPENDYSGAYPDGIDVETTFVMPPDVYIVSMTSPGYGWISAMDNRVGRLVGRLVLGGCMQLQSWLDAFHTW